MNFLQKVTNSVYNPSFYASVPNMRFRSGLAYFLLLTLFLSVIQFIQWLPGLWSLSPTVNMFVDNMVEKYPAELVVTIKNGQVSTNVDEPYIIPLAQFVDGQTMSQEGNLLVIDTQTPFSATKFNEYNTSAWLTKDALFVKSDSQIRTIDLSESSDTTIDRSLITYIVEQVRPWLGFITPAAFVLGFLVLYLSYEFKLLYLLLLAVLIWIIAKVMHKNLSYGQSYKVGLFAITLPLIVESILSFGAWRGFPFMFTLLALGVVFLNFTTQKTR